MKKSNPLCYLLIIMTLCISSKGVAQVQKNKTIFGKPVQHHSDHIRCVTTEYESYLQKKYKNRANQNEFERWISSKILKNKSDSENGRNTNNIITIPVVVHVIHNGDAYGTGENITDEQVLSQITVLNQDFRRMINSPGYNTNSVGADIEIEFCLVQQDPDGNETNGINRVNLTTASWGENAVESILKPQTQWDPTRYFNIWVCRFGGDLEGVLGYAQFPDSSGLGGLDTSGGNANTDGVIIGYQYFGSSDIYPAGTYDSPYDKGRTTTHEIGHYFGLRHIWGDNSSCTVNATDSNKDYCLDTPAASTANYGCATGTNSCTAAAGNDMIENYMDYSDDACMNLFTQNQKERIMAVLQNSPRRASLVNSNACNPPVVYELDGSLNIESLNEACETEFTPVIKLQNKGTITLTSVNITYNFDGETNQTFTWSGSLGLNEISLITLPSTSLNGGNHTFNASISLVNGNEDQNTVNNSINSSFDIINNYNTTQITLTLQRDYYGSETTWSLSNSLGNIVASGGPYSNSTSLPALITQNIAVDNNECYVFTINDEYGDGICCDYGNGYYNLKTSDNIIIGSGGEFGSTEIKNFLINSSLNVVDYSLNKITIAPNPVTEFLTIYLNNTEIPEKYSIYNSLGQLIISKKIEKTEDLNINTSNLSDGIYFLNISSNQLNKTIKFLKAN